MFEATKRKTNQEQEDDYVIRHTPNRVILFIDKTKWYWPVLFFVIGFSIFLVTNPSSTDQSNAPVSLEATIMLFIFFLTMLFIPFYMGVKLGANLYRPQKTALTKKQLRLFDQLLVHAQNEDNITVKFIRKDGKIELLGEEQE